MAYAATISLQHTMEQILEISHISLVPPSQEIIEFTFKELKSLHEILKKLDTYTSSMSDSRRERVNAVDGEIREAVFKLEDVLESHVLTQITAQSKSQDESRPLLFSIDVHDVEQYILSFAETVRKLEEEYVYELENASVEEEEEDDVVSSRFEFVPNKSKMVGLSDVYNMLKDVLMANRPITTGSITLAGMAGVGKTTLAKEIFEDPDFVEYFDCRVWVTVGRKCQVKCKSPITSIDSFQPNPQTEKITQYLKENLKGKRNFIVLDDVWNGMISFYLERLLPDESVGQFLVTSRLQELILMTRPLGIGMRLLNKEESWDLLCDRVFAEVLCPRQLVKAGKKIAEICDGLPLTIITVAELLSKVEKTPEIWSQVAAKKDHQLFIDAYNAISKVLYPSYDYLTQHLKMCFLYMGIFPQNYEIHKSELIKIWIAEGFLRDSFVRVDVDDYLNKLIFNNLVMRFKRVPSLVLRTKTCGLHSSMWNLCKREAGKIKFFYVLNKYADGLAHGIKSQRRLCIHNNILFGVKDVYNSLEDNCASTARSLLCYGPYLQYPVPICFNLRLLRVLDALTIHFYEFPMQVLELILLKYLALTYNGRLPASISKLWNLQFLIVHHHLVIKYCGAPLYLPMEIWDMKQLRHLHIMGSDLPDSYGNSLENLLTLLNVSAHSCTKGVLERIPNLEKLGIRIELAPDATEPLCCFEPFSHLWKLKSLKCVIVNPKFGSQFVPPFSMFPTYLRKLSLSGLGYPWEEMHKIASLPGLQVLKLRSNAFRGPRWEIEEDTFRSLQFLLIEDIDLVQLKVGRGSLARVYSLNIKHCYKLQELYWESNIQYPTKIIIDDCNPLAMDCVKQIKEAYDKVYPYGPHLRLDVYVHSSWENDGKLKT